jgi:hypothetical protein
MSIAIPSLRGAIAVPSWAKNDLWRRARAVPSLDHRFAESKSLVDAVSGQQLITFTRASDGAVVNSAGQIEIVAANVPRFTHDPVTGESLGLLVEEQRTNLLLRSEEFNSASWITSNTSVSANQETAPSGSIAADKLIENSANSTHRVSQAVGGVLAGVMTFSIYLKSAERTSAAVSLFTSADGERGINVNLATGQATSSFGSPTSSAISSAGNGWYRVSVSLTLSVTATVTALVYLNTYGTYVGDNASGIFLWGAQLE